MGFLTFHHITKVWMTLNDIHVQSLTLDDSIILIKSQILVCGCGFDAQTVQNCKTFALLQNKDMQLQEKTFFGADQEQNHHLASRSMALLHALGLEGLPLHCRKVAKNILWPMQ